MLARRPAPAAAEAAPTTPAPAHVAAPPADVVSTTERPPAEAPATETSSAARARGRGAKAPSTPASAPAATASTPETAPSAESTSRGGRRAERPAAERDDFATVGGVSGASMTAEELANASGLSVIELATLEGFGLIAPMEVAGVLYYDEEALTVAALAAEFGRYGIEARHLRLYRNAVDREMGLVEQIVTPLLRQRNPEARQRAAEAAADLARLGQGLRASLVRRDIRRQLGG